MKQPAPLNIDDIYNMMDEAGLNGSTLNNTRMPQAKIINAIRTQLAGKLKSYIAEREDAIKLSAAKGSKNAPTK